MRTTRKTLPSPALPTIIPVGWQHAGLPRSALLSAKRKDQSQLSFPELSAGIISAIHLSKGKQTATRAMQHKPSSGASHWGSPEKSRMLGEAESHRGEVSQQTCSTTRSPDYQREKMRSTCCKMCLPQRHSH